MIIQETTFTRTAPLSLPDNLSVSGFPRSPDAAGTLRISGGRLCTLIGVPWRGVSFSTFSTGRFVLKQYICKGAESAEHAETAGYTYEGTPTTA